MPKQAVRTKRHDTETVSHYAITSHRGSKMTRTFDCLEPFGFRNLDQTSKRTQRADMKLVAGNCSVDIFQNLRMNNDEDNQIMQCSG